MIHVQGLFVSAGGQAQTAKQLYVVQLREGAPAATNFCCCTKGAACAADSLSKIGRKLELPLPVYQESTALLVVSV